LPAVLKVGGYQLFRFGESSVWIENGDGEGGEFAAAALETNLAQFFNAHF
jgi:hypothetical protein